jgi:hypothetical protein
MLADQRHAPADDALDALISLLNSQPMLRDARRASFT